MNKKWLAIGCILLVFGIILFISGGEYRQHIENERKEVREAINNYPYKTTNIDYWLERMILLNMTKDFDNGFPVFLEVTGFLMVVGSFFVLVGGVYKKEKTE